MNEEFVKAINYIESEEDLTAARKLLRQRGREIIKRNSRLSVFIEKNDKPIKRIITVMLVLIGVWLYAFVAQTNGADLFSTPTLASNVARDSFAVANSYLEFAAPFLFLIAGMIFGANIMHEMISALYEMEL